MTSSREECKQLFVRDCGIYETSDTHGKVELATDSVHLTSCPKLREQANRTTAGDLFPQSMGRS